MAKTTGLTGAALLEKINELGPSASVSDQAKACGYATVRKDGKERLNFASFYRECAVAKGLAFAGRGGAGIANPRELSYKAKVSPAGQVMIGTRYGEMIGLVPGSLVDIIVHKGNIIIRPEGAAHEQAQPIAAAEPTVVSTAEPVAVPAMVA